MKGGKQGKGGAKEMNSRKADFLYKMFIPAHFCETFAIEATIDIQKGR